MPSVQVFGWEKNKEGRAPTKLSLNTGVGPNDPQHGGQSEAAPPRLRGEEGVEDLRSRVLIHPGASTGPIVT